MFFKRSNFLGRVLVNKDKAGIDAGRCATFMIENSLGGTLFIVMHARFFDAKRLKGTFSLPPPCAKE